MHDPVVRDSRLAASIFSSFGLLLLIGAALDLNTWPGNTFWVSLRASSLSDLFVAIQAFAAVLVLLFWGSNPNKRLKLLLLPAWALCASVLWAVPTLGASVRASPSPLQSHAFFLLGTLALPSALGIAWRVLRSIGSDNVLELRFRWLAVLTVLFIFLPQPALSLSAALHPHTLDNLALLWDRAAGLNLTPALIKAIDHVPGLPALVSASYNLTPLIFLSVPLLQLRGRPRGVPSGLLVWVGMTACAFVAYHFFPITGPRYIFGSEGFANALTGLATLHPEPMLLKDPFPRNGMPSMHFGWALAATILWCQSKTKSWTRSVFSIATALTAAGTLYLGEHYVIDLVVAVPFVLASLALCTTDVSWRHRARWSTVALGFGCWLAWVFALRIFIDQFLTYPILCQLALLITAAVVVQQAAQIRQLQRGSLVEDITRPAITAHRSQSPLMRRFWAMFFASGFAALVYQVLFAKQLALIFGSTSTATLTVLSTFLGGMALGALAGGYLAERIKHPLVAYAYVEVAIGAYCILTPTLFQSVQALYVWLAIGADPGAPGLIALRVMLGGLVLLVPTFLMGATLPILAHSAGTQSGRMGHRVAWLYFANTLGASAGALLTAYIVIPALGAVRTTLVAAMLNMLVGLLAIECSRRFTELAGRRDHDEAFAHNESERAQPRTVPIALLSLGLCGVLSLGLEVVYFHMLSIVAGNSVYAFGLMVSTFLVGLALGGEGARRILLLPGNHGTAALAASLLALGGTVALGAMLWNEIPGYFAGFSEYPIVRSFGAREGIRGLICALLMIPPTLFIGAAYVFAIDALTNSTRSKSVYLGLGAFVNTVGNILGVLMFGFVVLPWAGGLEASKLIALAAWLLGAAVTVMAGLRNSRSMIATAATCAVVIAGAGSTKLDYNALSTGANVYFSSQQWGEVIDHAESMDGGLTMVARRQEDDNVVHTLLTNGKFQGNDALDGEMHAQVGFAMVPLLHQDKRDQALVIGYGTGVTARVLSDAGFAHLDIAELSGDVVRLADKHFSAINGKAASRPGVKMHVTDGRNLLLLSQRQYDLISIEITSIWFSGAAALYNKDFYELARSRMAPQGVLQQWVQLHRLTPVDILHVVSSLRAVFRYVSLYGVGGQGVLVATNDPARAHPTDTAFLKLHQSGPLAEVRRLLGKDVQDFTDELLLGPEGVDRMMSGAGKEGPMWWSTDDNMRLEYSTPRANVNDPGRTSRINRDFFQMYR